MVGVVPSTSPHAETASARTVSRTNTRNEGRSAPAVAGTIHASRIIAQSRIRMNGAYRSPPVCQTGLA